MHAAEQVHELCDPQSQDNVDAGYNGPGWYFFDETEAHMHGPFLDQAEAEKKRDDYFVWLNTGKAPR